MAFDVDGNVGKDSVALDYSEPLEGAPVNIISPSNGQVFDVSEKSVITVRGTIGYQGNQSAKLILNGNPMDIVVKQGPLRAEGCPVAGAERDGSGSRERPSRRLAQPDRNRRYGYVKPKDIMVVLSWDKPHADLICPRLQPVGWHTDYKQPNTYESKDAIPGGQLEQDAKGNFGPEVFDQGHSERGIYTVEIQRYYSGGDGDAHAKVTIILYGDNPSRKIVRAPALDLQRDTKMGPTPWRSRVRNA